MGQLLAVDVDGTLVRRDGSIEERDRQAIARLRQRGVIVTLATGRLYEGTRAVADELGLVTPLICANGASLICHPDGDELFHAAIAVDDAELVRQALRKRQNKLTVALIANGAVVVDQGSAPYEAIVRTWSPNLERTANALEHPNWTRPRIFAVIAFGDREAIEAAEAEVQAARAIDVVRFDFPAPQQPSTLSGRPAPVGRAAQISALITSPAGVSKATGIVAVAEHCGCSLDQVVAVGDWINDIPMFRVVGRSFVMAGAPDAVLEAASDHLEAVAHAGGGVAEAIERVWG